MTWVYHDFFQIQAYPEVHHSISYSILFYCIMTYHILYYMKKASRAVGEVRWQLGPWPQALFHFPFGQSAQGKKGKLKCKM